RSRGIRMVHRLASSRLAAKSGIRQVEAIAQADTDAIAVDRAIGGLWQELLALLRNPQGYHEDYTRALAILKRVQPTAYSTVRLRLTRLAHWSYKQTAQAIADELPLPYLQAAALKEGKQAGRMPFVPDIRQSKDYSCGAAALRAVAHA